MFFVAPRAFRCIVRLNPDVGDVGCCASRARATTGRAARSPAHAIGRAGTAGRAAACAARRSAAARGLPAPSRVSGVPAVCGLSTTASGLRLCVSNRAAAA
jgi:hypothetical protein